MVTTVTYTEFRDNLSKYINLLKKKGSEVVLKDGRSGKEIVRLKKAKEELSLDAYIKEVKNMKPFLTKKGINSMKKFREEINDRLE